MCAIMFKISEVHVHIYVKKGSHPPTIPFGLPSMHFSCPSMLTSLHQSLHLDWMFAFQGGEQSDYQANIQLN